MSKREEVYARIEQRRQRLIEGKVNSIPSPFVKFSNDFIGWEQGVYYLISSFTKGGKSQLVSYLLFEAIMFLYENIKAGNDVDLDEYKAIADRFIEKLHTPNVVLMPEYAVKDITVFKRELSGTSNMFLDGGYLYEQSY